MSTGKKSKPTSADVTQGTHPFEGGGKPARFLAVGDMNLPPQSDDAKPQPDITCLPFEEVTPEALARIRPDVVFSSLVGPGFDCLDLAERLANAGFRGQYRAIAPTVPNPALVRREITDRFPALDFDLVVLAERGGRRGD